MTETQKKWSYGILGGLGILLFVGILIWSLTENAEYILTRLIGEIEKGTLDPLFKLISR